MYKGKYDRCNSTYFNEQVVAVLNSIPVEMLRKSRKELAESQEFRKLIRELVTNSTNHLNMMDRALLLQYVLDDLLALGPISRIMRNDRDVSEIVIVRLNKVLIRKNGIESVSSESFRDEKHLQSVLRNIDEYAAIMNRDTDPGAEISLSKGVKENGEVIYTILFAGGTSAQ